MAARRIFSSTAGSSVVGDALTARLGELALPGRKPIQTPNFIGVASRGVIPHLTPDNLTRYSSVGSVYMALEDCT
jgi:queuine tRNA-ribosyltransferase accessory subunit